jgi:hypothetical protein
MDVYDAVPTPAQLEALVTALCVVGCADGELTCEALGKLGHELDEVGWWDRLSEDEIDVLLERAADRARAIAELGDGAARHREIQRLARELKTAAMRKTAYAMAWAIDPRAQAVLGALAAVLAV